MELKLGPTIVELMLICEDGEMALIVSEWSSKIEEISEGELLTKPRDVSLEVEGILEISNCSAAMSSCPDWGSRVNSAETANSASTALSTSAPMVELFSSSVADVVGVGV